METFLSQDILHTADFYFGDYLFQNNISEQGQEEYSAFVGKIDRFGDWQWAKTWDSATSSSEGYSITSDSNGNVIFTGETYGTNMVSGTGYLTFRRGPKFICCQTGFIWKLVMGKTDSMCMHEYGQ